MVQMSKRPSNHGDLRVLGSFRNFAILHAKAPSSPRIVLLCSLRVLRLCVKKVASFQHDPAFRRNAVPELFEPSLGSFRNSLSRALRLQTPVYEISELGPASSGDIDNISVGGGDGNPYRSGCSLIAHFQRHRYIAGCTPAGIATLICVRPDTFPAAFADLATVPVIRPSGIRLTLMDAADFRLRELKGQLGIDAPHAVIDAAIAAGVSEEAILRKADLIVVGRGRAQDTFERIWSHVYPIVREAPCPVLSI
jgi:hypothetical protein